MAILIVERSLEVLYGLTLNDNKRCMLSSRDDEKKTIGNFSENAFI